jgi:hypothetical protein
MKKVMQTKFGQKQGNCFQAAVASLFELELDQVPDFCNLYKSEEEWFGKFVQWLNKKGLSAIMISTDIDDINRPNYKDCYLLVGGVNQDSTNHEVVYCNSMIAHDPNPNTKKFTPRDVILIFKQNPRFLGD